MNVLRRYEAQVRSLLEKHASGDAKGRSQQTDANAEAKIANLQADEVRIRDAYEQYRTEITEEHERWMNLQSIVAEADETLMNKQVETVVQSYLDPGLRDLGAAVQQRCKARLAALSRSAGGAAPGGQGFDGETCSSTASGSMLGTAEAAAAAAQEAFVDDVCRDAVTSMRYEWRQEQRKVLQLLAREMQAHRQASVEFLEGQLSAVGDIDSEVQSLWDAQRRRLQDELDALAEKYRSCVRRLYEAKLREARQHADEQAAFFRREIREALEAEEEEKQLHEGQLRRMRLALLKWRHDYIKDARSRATEAQLRRLAADAEDEESQAFSDVEEAKIDGKQRRLEDCRIVLSKVWEHLPVDEGRRRDFLFRLNELIPFTERMRTLYEDHLAAHGVLPALDDCDDCQSGGALSHGVAAPAMSPS